MVQSKTNKAWDNGLYSSAPRWFFPIATQQSLMVAWIPAFAGMTEWVDLIHHHKFYTFSKMRMKGMSPFTHSSTFCDTTMPIMWTEPDGHRNRALKSPHQTKATFLTTRGPISMLY
jgi:hypothetical protein